MKLVAQIDAYSCATGLFDPDLLPAGFHQRSRDDCMALIQELTAQGHFVYCETEFEDISLLHLYVNEAVPEELLRYCIDVTDVEAFTVSSGRIWFSDLMSAFHQDPKFLIKNPEMRAEIEIPAGIYKVRSMRTEYPEEYIDDQIKNTLSQEEYRNYQQTEGLAAKGCFMFVAIAVTLWWLEFSIQSLWLVPLLLAYWGYACKRLGASKHRMIKEKIMAIESNYPRLVAEFRSLPIQ